MRTTTTTTTTTRNVSPTSRRLKLLIVLLLAAPLALCEKVVAVCNVNEAALYLCKYDSECSDAFYIDTLMIDPRRPQRPYTLLYDVNNAADVREYDRNLFYHHHNILMSRSGAKQILESSSLCNDTSIQSLWMVTMCMSHICGANEVYEIGTGCVCLHGKLCTEEDGYVYYGTPYLFIIISVVSAAVLVLTLFSLRVVLQMESIIHCTIEQLSSSQPQEPPHHQPPIGAT